MKIVEDEIEKISLQMSSNDLILFLARRLGCWRNDILLLKKGLEELLDIDMIEKIFEVSDEYSCFFMFFY